MTTINTLISDPNFTGAYWQVLLAGFASPKYVGPAGQSDAAGALGFPINDCESILSAIENNTAAATIVAEQTMDPTGLNGWYQVVGKRVDNPATQTANANALGVAYVFPRAGVRMRFRTTALTTADLRMRIYKTDVDFDLAPGTIVLSGTVTIQGAIAQDAAITGTTPVVPIGGESRDAVKAQMSAEGDNVAFWLTRNGRNINVPWAPAPLSWVYAPPTAGYANLTSDLVLKAAAGAGIRNVLESFTLGHDVLGAVSEYVIKDGSTVVFRGKLQTPALEDREIVLPRPIRGTANTAFNFATITAVTGSIFINAHGHTMND